MIPTIEEIEREQTDFAERLHEEELAPWLTQTVLAYGNLLLRQLEEYYRDLDDKKMCDNLADVLKGMFALGYLAKKNDWRITKE